MMSEMTRDTKNDALYLGIDVGGMTVKIGLFRGGKTSAGNALPQPVLMDRTVIPTRTEDDGIRIIPDIAEAVQRLAGANGIDPGEIAGAGIGVPGPVLPENPQGFPVNKCVNLNWKDIRYIDAELRELTGIQRIVVMNDANAAALGELFFGGAEGEEEAGGADAEGMAASAVMVTLGTGIGGGVIQDGRIITGAFGAAGEIGHMPISPSHPLLRKICEHDTGVKASADLEYYASATGIARIGAAALLVFEEDSQMRSCDDLTAKAVIDAAKDGDAIGLAVMEFFFDTLGQYLAAIASVVDPELFIIGGGVSAAGDYLLEGLKETYRKYVFHASRETAFRLASLGNDAGLLGPLVPLLQQ